MIVLKVLGGILLAWLWMGAPGALTLLEAVFGKSLERLPIPDPYPNFVRMKLSGPPEAEDGNRFDADLAGTGDRQNNARASEGP